MKFFILMSAFFVLFSCKEEKKPEVSTQNTEAASSVFVRGKEMQLYKEGGKIQVGQSFLPLLTKIADDSLIKGKVSLISIVPSIDTPTCEAQTHILGEDKELKKDVFKVTISRDLPMAQKRFAEQAKLDNITYFSDFNLASFGKDSGLLIPESGLLARAVLVTDKEGIIQYLQVVPEITKLPDMKKAIEFANSLLTK